MSLEALGDILHCWGVAMALPNSESILIRNILQCIIKFDYL